jgi:Lar family restriction alleviation protein
MSDERLRKCPFCGGEVELIEEEIDAIRTAYGFCCNNCCMYSYYSCYDREEAIEAWNNRKPVDDVLEQIEALKNDFITCMRDSDYLRGNVNFAVNAIEIIKEEMN